MKFAAVLLVLWGLPAFGQEASKPQALPAKEWRDAVIAGLEDAEKWKPFTALERDFSVLLPGVPKRVVQANPEHDSVTYTLQDGKRFYFAARQSYKTDVTKTQSPQQLLDRGCDGMINGLQGKLLSKETISLDKKYPGREVQFARGAAMFRVRAYWIPPVMYLTVVRGDKDFVSGTDAALFLNSFKAIGK